MQLHFRPARADDVDAAIDLIYSSGPGAFDYVFADAAGDARHFLRRAFVDGAGQFGHRNHVVGEADGRVVAVGTGFGRESSATFTLAALRQILAHYGLRAAGPVVRGLRTEGVIRPPGRGEHYLAHLGVAPECRGQGIGRALVAHLLDAGRALGRSSATLDVAVDNPRAEQLYQRLGFAVVAERPSRLGNAHGHVPGHRRMALALA